MIRAARGVIVPPLLVSCDKTFAAFAKGKPMTQHNPIPPLDPPVPPPVPLYYSATPSKDEINLGMLCHLLGIFTSFIGPMIIWLLKKDESGYVDAQAKEAMNFQITAVLAMLCCVFGFCFAPFLFAAVHVGRLVFSIIASVKSSNGELYRYPICIRLLK